jgi:hypothetical protein
MSWTCGIIGLPNAGKTTIFNALTAGQAEVASYPFSTIAPNIGVVPVPDPRLARLGDLLHPQRLTAATISFVDVAGLIEGASRGGGPAPGGGPGLSGAGRRYPAVPLPALNPMAAGQLLFGKRCDKRDHRERR